MDRVLILNGAPRSGKDTLATKLFAAGTFWNHVDGSFKRPLQNIAAAILGMTEKDFLDQYETIKDQPCPNGLPLTVRELMIKISEEWVKPLAGKRFFGDEAYRRALVDCGRMDTTRQPHYRWQVRGTTVVFTDGGFGEEVLKFIEELGPENVYIVRIIREGHTFEKDSRRLLQKHTPGLEKCQFFSVFNNGTREDLLNSFNDIVLDKMRGDSLP